MSCLGKIWGNIASAWAELESLYEKKDYKKLYRLIEKLSPADLEENCDRVDMGNGVSISMCSEDKGARE